MVQGVGGTANSDRGAGDDGGDGVGVMLTASWLSGTTGSKLVSAGTRMQLKLSENGLGKTCARWHVCLSPFTISQLLTTRFRFTPARDGSTV